MLLSLLLADPLFLIKTTFFNLSFFAIVEQTKNTKIGFNKNITNKTGI